MSGYVGFVNKIDNTEEVLNEMMAKIEHRGPDGNGQFIDDGIALGYVMLDTGSAKVNYDPITSSNGELIIAFNGEIYNRSDLKIDLEKKGHKFPIGNSAEVVLRGYEEYGVAILDKLRGMFSFVIWNKISKEIFGVRDFFGIKPLYYANMGETFLFGSEIKALIPHPHFIKELNTNTLETYLTFQYSPTEQTFFNNVYKLPPAHYFLYKDGDMKIHRYWEVDFQVNRKGQTNQDKTLDDYVDEVEKVMTESVALHKTSDVEVGSFLSSGVDSSYVACLSGVDKTFTVGFDNEQYNEISYAKEFAHHIGTQNINRVISASEYWDSLPKLQYHMDEPLADPAAVALYFVCKLASEHIKVVLSGEGADELFGGYNVYKEPIEMTIYNIIPMPIRRLIGNIASKFRGRRGLNFLVRRGKTLEERFIGNAYMFSEKERKSLLNVKTDAPSSMEITMPFYEKVKDKDTITKMQYIDIHLWMAGDILLKADRMSTANSIEVRCPFLDKNVMEVASQIPTKFRVNKENTKYAMRLAANRKIPSAAANKKKLGFPVPIRVWLREEFYYNKVKSAFTTDTAKKYFNTDKLVELLDRHRSNRADNSRKIWTIYMFLIWYEEYFGEN